MESAFRMLVGRTANDLHETRYGFWQSKKPGKREVRGEIFLEVGYRTLPLRCRQRLESPMRTSPRNRVLALD